MKYYVDFDGWAIVEANSEDEAIERFCENAHVINITYTDIFAEKESGEEVE